MRVRTADRSRAVERVAIACGWLGFVWASTHWYAWQRTVDLLFGGDMPDYERIARAAPGFTNDPMSSQHADRFVPHYLVGLGSDLLHVGVRPLFYVCAFALLLVIVLLVDRAIAPFGLGRNEYALCVGALVANPYLFRFLAICPARLADSVFIIGGLVAFFGLLRANAWLLVAGLVVATLGRSEAAFALIALAPLGIRFAPDWARRALRLRVAAATASVALPLAVYAVLRVAARSFSENDYPGFWQLTIFGSIRDLPGSGGRIGLHVARLCVGIAGAGALVVGAVVARRWSRTDRLPFAFWAALVSGTVVSAEAFVLNPAWLKGSEPLLASFGAALLVVAAAAALGTLDRTVASPPVWTVVAIAGLIGTSLHHRFAAISPVSTPGHFAAVAAVSALAVVCGVSLRSRRLAPELA